MSRAALARQLARQFRDPGASAASSDPFDAIEHAAPQDDCADGGGLAIYGSARTFNFENVLAVNVVSSKYFRFTLMPMSKWEELIEEVALAGAVKHLEPWQPGTTARTPSAAFCCVFRLAVMRVTLKQMERMLSHDSPYVRAVALLYLRYTAEPAEMWGWFSATLEDGAASPLVNVKAVPVGASSSSSSSSSSGEYRQPLAVWARGLLEDFHYQTTLLPRLPVAVQQDIAVKLVLLDKDADRCAANAKYAADLTPGLRVRARWTEDGEWYDGTLVRPAEANEGGKGKGVGKWWVQYSGFATKEMRGLGQIELVEKPRAGAGGSSSSSSHGGAGASAGASASGAAVMRDPRLRDGSSSRRSRSRSRSRERDRDRGYDRDRRSRSRSRSRDRDRYRHRSRSRSRERERDRDGYRDRDRDYDRRPRDRDLDRDLDRDRDRGRDARHRSRSRSWERDRGRDRDRDRSWSRGRDGVAASTAATSAGGGTSADDYETIRRQIVERDRAKAVATGKDYAARVTGYKASLAGSGGGRGRDSRSPSRDRRDREPERVRTVVTTAAPTAAAAAAAAPAPAPAAVSAPAPAVPKAINPALASILARYTDGGGSSGGGGGGGRPAAGPDAHRHAKDVDGEDVLTLGT